MTEYLKGIRGQFNEHIKSVRQLMNFDRFLLDFCIFQIEALEDRIKNNKTLEITNPYLLPTNTLRMLRTVRQNDSLRTQYNGIFNQCLVLVVSYYTSILSSIFKESINFAGQHSPALIESSNEDLRISLSELRQYNFNLAENLGDIIIKKKDLSFQDMQSVSRSFKNFLGIEIAKDKALNNIIVAQASRHAIVHSLAIADEKFIKQIADANPRDVLPVVLPMSTIHFQPGDIDRVIYSMEIQIDKMISEIDARIQQKSR
jgi:hypothetical protein